MKCSDCKFWVDISANKLGECHFHAPTPVIGLSEGAPRVASWPRTGASNFCGVFTAKAEKRVGFV